MCRFLCGHKISTHFCKCQGLWLLDGTMFGTMFSLVRNCKTVFQNGCTILQWMTAPVASHSCQHLVLAVFGFCHSNWCVVVIYCCSNFQFPNNIWCGGSLHMLICHLYIFYSEVSAQLFGLFFSWFVYFLIVEF